MNLMPRRRPRPLLGFRDTLFSAFGTTEWSRRQRVAHGDAFDSVRKPWTTGPGFGLR